MAQKSGQILCQHGISVLWSQLEETWFTDTLLRGMGNSLILEYLKLHPFRQVEKFW